MRATSIAEDLVSAVSGVARARAELAAALIVLVATFSAVAASPPAGRIEGTITLNHRLGKRPMRFNLYPDAVDPSSAHARHRAAVDERMNVVVYLESVPASAWAAAPGARPVIRQEDEMFVPHVLPVLEGTTVEFVNGDPLYHNVFSLSRAATFDLGRMPRDTSKSVRFDRPGAVKVFCHIHSDMSAVVLVLENPFFAVPSADGHYALADVPPGDYRAVAWHERAKPVIRTAHVDAGGVVTLDFSVPVDEDGE